MQEFIATYDIYDLLINFNRGKHMENQSILWVLLIPIFIILILNWKSFVKWCLLLEIKYEIFLEKFYIVTIPPTLVIILFANLIPDFRKSLYEYNVLQILSTFMLFDIFRRVIKLNMDKKVVISANQASANKYIREFIKNSTPHNAKLLEYSSKTISPIFSDLKDVGCCIKLLIQHPEYTINQKQKQRIYRELENLFDEKIGDGPLYGYKNLEVRCYKSRSSLRFRNFDDKRLQLGWYLYSFVKKEKYKGPDIDKNHLEDLYGATNPVIDLDLISNDEKRLLLEMCNEHFDSLWNDSETTCAKKVFEEYDAKNKEEITPLVTGM